MINIYIIKFIFIYLITKVFIDKYVIFNKLVTSSLFLHGQAT